MSETHGRYALGDDLTDEQVFQGQAIWAKQTGAFAAACRIALDNGLPLSEMRQIVGAEYRRYYERFVADVHAEGTYR